jgi:hypothetical protein
MTSYLLVSEKDLEDDEKTNQTYLMLLQLEDLEFAPLSPTSSPMSRLPLLHLCSTLVSPRFKDNSNAANGGVDI